MAAKTLTVCPKDLCARKKWGHGKVIKKISGGGGLIFKGSGFYITDYRSDKYKESAKQDIAASRPPTESKPAASDSKPAAKSESKPAKSPPKK